MVITGGCVCWCRFATDFPEIDADNAHPDDSLPETQLDTRVCVT